MGWGHKARSAQSIRDQTSHAEWVSSSALGEVLFAFVEGALALAQRDREAGEQAWAVCVAGASHPLRFWGAKRNPVFSLFVSADLRGKAIS